MDRNEAHVYEIFKELGITDFTLTEHDAIMSTEDSDRLGLAMEGLNCKNLFIKEKKADKFYMVTIDEHRMMDMNHFKEVAGWKKVRFAHDEELMETLGLLPGSVTPLALFNDAEKKVICVLGKEVVEAPGEEKITFHPCRNTASLTMRKGDFLRYLSYVGNTVIEEA